MHPLFTFVLIVIPTNPATSADQCSPHLAQSQRTSRTRYQGFFFVDREDFFLEYPCPDRSSRLEGIGVRSVHERRHRDSATCSRLERCRRNLACVRPPLLIPSVKPTLPFSSQLHSTRPPLPDVPAVYFVAPTLQNVRRIAQDLESNLYESFYLNFVEPLSRALLEELAAAVAKDGTGELITQVGSF